MQLQAYRGYFEQGNFYTAGKIMKIPERWHITLIFEDPPQNDIATTERFVSKDDEQERRKAWLEKLDAAIDLGLDEDFPDIIRSNPMRVPVNLSESR